MDKLINLTCSTLSEQEKTEKVFEFKNAIQSGIDGIVKASEIYVEAIDADPDMQNRFQIETDGMFPSSAWKQFEAIGRKWIHPKLIFGGINNKQLSAEMKKAPFSIQNSIFNGLRFDLLLSDGDTLKVSPLELSYAQVQQLFDNGNIRTLSQQKAFIAQRQTKLAERMTCDPMPLGYSISGGRVVFRADTILTRVEIKRILEEIS